LGIGDWGLGIGDWGVGSGADPHSPIANPQSPIPNPQSPIPNPHKISEIKINDSLNYFKFLINIYPKINLNKKY